MVLESIPWRMSDCFFLRAESVYNVAAELENVGVVAAVAYESTEHFQVSREFLAAPERMLAMFLSDEE